jgi:ATP-dependent Clp protease ATP-binding subunit ClpA
MEEYAPQTALQKQTKVKIRDYKTENFSRKKLDPTLNNKFLDYIKNKMIESIIGQSDAVENAVNMLSKISSGIKSKEGPILSMLFLGSTGTGKTEFVKILAECLFGERNAFVRINCQELLESHTVSKLLGSPPGYVGGEIPALLAQKNIDKHCIEARRQKKGIFGTNVNINSNICNDGSDLSIILFDEIEKAHPKIWTTLLGIMDDGIVTLSNNKDVNMKNCIIIMTSNVGSQNIIDHSTNKHQLGFVTQDDNTEHSFKEMQSGVMEEFRNLFPPEFCNRFDKVVVFNVLKPEHIKEIFYINMKAFQNTLTSSKCPIKLEVTKDVVDFITKMSYHPEYGARDLNRNIQLHIQTPIMKLISSEQIIPGDILSISIIENEIEFVREKRTLEQLNKFYIIEDNEKPKTNRPKRTVAKSPRKTKAKTGDSTTKTK